MSKLKYMKITIDGPIACGKSAALQAIKTALEEHGLCVAIPDREERFNPSKIEFCSPDNLVVVLVETCN